MTVKVHEAFRLKQTSGLIGVELEYEGANLPPKGFEPYWIRTVDNSLRGDSGEFVFRQPLTRDQVQTAFKTLESSFKMYNTKIIPTYRAGTHVHVNVQELSMAQLINYLVLYFMFETALLKLCSEERTGNHFCLRLKDASSLGDLLADFIQNPVIETLKSDNYRYAAVNINSVPKFGSLEFRSLESTTDWGKLELWIDLLLKLKETAKSYDNPAAVLLSASGEGFREFGKKVFGNLWGFLSQKVLEEDVRENVWEIQHAVFAKNWSEVNLNIFSKSNIFD